MAAIDAWVNTTLDVGGIGGTGISWTTTTTTTVGPSTTDHTTIVYPTNIVFQQEDSLRTPPIEVTIPKGFVTTRFYSVLKSMGILTITIKDNKKPFMSKLLKGLIAHIQLTTGKNFNVHMIDRMEFKYLPKRKTKIGLRLVFNA